MPANSFLRIGSVAAAVLIALVLIGLLLWQRQGNLLQTRVDQPLGSAAPSPVVVSPEQCELSYHECLVCFGAHPETEYGHHCAEACRQQYETCLQNPPAPDPNLPVLIDPATGRPVVNSVDGYGTHH